MKGRKRGKDETEAWKGTESKAGRDRRSPYGDIE
jgi:hypothetical protein